MSTRPGKVNCVAKDAIAYLPVVTEAWNVLEIRYAGEDESLINEALGNLDFQAFSSSWEVLEVVLGCVLGSW